MARATTKIDLINTANEQFEKMWQLIDAMTEKTQNAAFNYGNISAKKEAHWARDKNLRDILIHLYEWHQLLLNWFSANQKGDYKPFLPAPYNWKTYGGMNVEFWEKHQPTPLADAKTMLKDSHNQVMEMIAPLSGDELFAKKHFSWTGTTSFGSYCISATASHYDWAIKKIKLHSSTYIEAIL